MGDEELRNAEAGPVSPDIALATEEQTATNGATGSSDAGARPPLAQPHANGADAVARVPVPKPPTNGAGRGTGAPANRVNSQNDPPPSALALRPPSEAMRHPTLERLLA